MDLGLTGKVAVVTGAGGALCGEIASALAGEGAKVAIWDLSREAGERKAQAIRDAGGIANAFACDVSDRALVESATEGVLAEFGAIDILINGAGGSHRGTTTSDDLEFFDIEVDALAEAMKLNYASAVVPSQIVGRVFARQGLGVILGIASIAGLCPLTRSMGYSNAKAAVCSFTQWLAVHMAQRYSPKIRVNAIAPGFMLTNQNRFLLVDEKTAEMTERGRQIVAAVPMGRYGEPHEVVGAALWLVSDAASFVTGAVIPVDGGFMACSGV